MSETGDIGKGLATFAAAGALGRQLAHLVPHRVYPDAYVKAFEANNPGVRLTVDERRELLRLFTVCADDARGQGAEAAAPQIFEALASLLAATEEVTATSDRGRRNLARAEKMARAALSAAQPTRPETEGAQRNG